MSDSSYPSLQLSNSRRQILRMALPISLAILIPQLNFVINNIFLGHYLDDSLALAVAGITGVYYLIFAAIGYGLNNGLQTLIARRAGENRPDEIGKLFNQGVWIGLGLALGGILITYTLTPYFFSLIIQDQQVLHKAVSFMQIRIWGLLFLYIYQLRNALLVGTNQSRYLVAGTVAETASNILLDYVLIYGTAGFPELGFQGAAYASVIAEFIGMFVIYLVIRQKGIARRFELFASWTYSPKHIKSILSVSAPLMFQHAISIISFQYFFLLIEHHGAMAMKISNIMRNIFGVFGCLSWAFASTTNAMVSNLIGQGKQDQVISLLKKIVQLSSGSIFLIAVLLNIFPEAFLSLFGQDEDFTVAALPVLRIVTVALLMMSVSTIMLNMVTATGNTRITFYIEVIAVVLYCLYIYIVSELFFLPITYSWMSEWLYWICLFTPSFYTSEVAAGKIRRFDFQATHS